MFSVIIPLYNKEVSISRTIKSIQNQSYQDFEIIIVDDGSTDNGMLEVHKINDNRIRCFYQENRGVSSARNRGIKEAKGEWVAFLDADDEWNSEYLQIILQLQKKFPDCNVCATAYIKQNAKGEKCSITLNNTQSIVSHFVLDNYFEVAATSDPPIHTSSICVKKSSILSVGGFPEDVSQGEDLLTWAKLASNNKIAYCREAMTIFHTGEYSTMEKPKRIPSDYDIVGKGLGKIYENNPNLFGIKQYIAHWHKMRASIYLRLPKASHNCRKEIREAQHWHRNKKLYLYNILTFIPYTLRMKLLKRLT